MYHIKTPIFDILKTYINNSKDLMIEAEFSYQKPCAVIIQDINLKKLHYKILLYVVPYFQLEIDQHKQLTID